MTSTFISKTLFRLSKLECFKMSFLFYFSWLLRQYPLQVRSSHPFFKARASKYLKELLARVKHLQFFTQNGPRGGPVI